MSNESQLSCEFDTTEPDFRDITFVDENVLFETNSLSKLGDTTTGVPGCLLGKTLFYLEIKASQYIKDTVSSGYKILFFDDQPPPKFCKRNNKSALDNSAFVYTELKKLESLGWLVVISLYNPFLCKA